MRRRRTHEYKLVPAQWYKDLPQEEKEELAKQEVMDAISARLSLVPDSDRFRCGLGAIAEFHNHFPGSDLIEEPGAWILIKEELPTPYTPPPLSIWFAVPWPMNGCMDHTCHRVKIITPRGELGVFPHEYSKIKDIAKYYEFIGQGMEIKFFGGVQGVPADALFYLRSRGISKSAAITMLMSLIKASEVCWLEASKETVKAMGFTWPHKSRLATVKEQSK